MERCWKSRGQCPGCCWLCRELEQELGSCLAVDGFLWEAEALSPGCRHRLKSLLCSFAEFSVVPGDKSLGFAAERLSLEHAWVSGSNPSRCRLLPRVIPSQINRVSSSQELGFISGAPRRSSVSTARLERCRSTLDFRRNPPSVCPFARANRG